MKLKEKIEKENHNLKILQRKIVAFKKYITINY